MSSLIIVLKRFVKSHYARNTLVWRAIAYVYSRFHGFRVRSRGGTNRVVTSGVLMKRVSIQIVGTDNEILIGPGSRLTCVSISIHGSHCKLRIGAFCAISGSFTFEDDRSEIHIGDGTDIACAEISAIEGQMVSIGQGCMFSAGIIVRNGDSHSIMDSRSGKRINPSQSIQIGDRVWLARQVIVLKGSVIGDDTVIGAAALVAGEVPAGVIAAGVPAKVVKTGITWRRERIPQCP